MIATSRIEQRDADVLFADELVPGERLVWTGRPSARRRLAPGDWIVIPFSIVWAGFAVFWEAMAVAAGAPLGFVLFGIPFVVVGLYMLVGRFLFRTWVRQRTFFALTDRRALALRVRRSGKSSVSVFLDRVPSIEKDVRSDGSGTVTFGSSRSARTARSAVWPDLDDGSGTPAGTVVFYDLVDADEVWRLAQRLATPASDSSGFAGTV